MTGKSRRRRRQIVRALIAVCMLMQSCAPKSDEVAPEPTQRALVENFRVHRQEFEYMRSLANQQPQITNITSRDQPVYGGKSDEKISVSDKRIPLMRRAMQHLHVIFFVNDFDGTATFTMWLGPPSLKDRVSKGIVYSPRPPAPIYDSPDWDNVRPPNPIYARIKADWYIFWDGG